MRSVLLQIAVLTLSTVATAQETTSSNPVNSEQTEYICSMYCTDEVSTTPARCRVCKMEMEDRKVVENPKDNKILSPQQAFDRMKTEKGIVLLDVRSRKEYNDELGHLENSMLIPIDELAKRTGELTQYKDKTIIAYCSHGIRSARAAKLLTKKGFSVYSLMGGLTKWNRDGHPVVRESQ